jgi:phosphate transport system permease protein
LRHKKNYKATLIRTGVYAASTLSVGILIAIVVYICIKGIPNLSLSLFSFEYNSTNVSLFPALVNTILMTALSLLIAVPVGVFSAIYLAEYARRGNRIVKVIRMTAETLSGIPSIVYGLFGYLMFVVYFGWGYSILAGAFTLAIMILPVIMRTTEEALKSVDDAYREASFGLGAGKLRTVFKIVLPTAVPGILSGVILSIGRIVGETAALIYTSGTVAKIPSGFLSSARTFPCICMFYGMKVSTRTNRTRRPLCCSLLSSA